MRSVILERVNTCCALSGSDGGNGDASDRKPLGAIREAVVMGCMTLREVQKALATAKEKEAEGSATSPTVEELESLARTLQRQAEEDPAVKGAAEQGASADGGGRRGSRRAPRSHGPRRR